MKNFKLIFFGEKETQDLLKGCLYIDIDFSDCVIDVCTSRDSSGNCTIYDACGVDMSDGGCGYDVCGVDFNSNCTSTDSCSKDGDNPYDCPKDTEQSCFMDICNRDSCARD